MSYQGVERRRFFTYVTRNTEYHFHDGICVAVRDRRTGQFLAAHVARGMRLVGGVNMLLYYWERRLYARRSRA